MSDEKPIRVGLFVTCLVDLFRPTVGFAAIRLLEQAGCEVGVPASQTCCGQPAYNSGDRADTAAIAEQVITAFEGFDYVVAPSGSCAAMIAKHYPALFDDGTGARKRAEDLASKTYELVQFLADVLNIKQVDASFDGIATYHDSCSGLREMGIKHQPRRLLKSVEGLTLNEMEEAETCCGFGGTFCIKYPDISNDMVEKKSTFITDTKAELLLAGDLGCLMNMAGKLSRGNNKIAARHVAEVLADMTDGPAIGEPAKKG